MDLIAERSKIPRDSERGRTGAYERHFFPIGRKRSLGHEVQHIIFKISSDTLQPADGYRLFLHTSTATCRLAGAVAGAAKDTRKDITVPVDHVCFGIFS